MYVEGNRHAGEVTAGESALWMLHHLLTGYGTDKEATRLVDDFAFYFRPVNNPDGSLLYLETAQTLRSTIRPTTATATACSTRIPPRTSTATVSCVRCA